ncbi:MAG: DUF1460 domain-containing protein [Plesiomonas sp.]
MAPEIPAISATPISTYQMEIESTHVGGTLYGGKSPIAADSKSEAKINEIIQSKATLSAKVPYGDVIEYVSSAFLNTPYKANTLIGGIDTPEVLTVNLSDVDCFTLLDDVEALSKSHDMTTFLYNLAQTRYINGEVSYLKRRHFFSDWFATASPNALDVTLEISKHHNTVEKQLNRKPDGGEYVSGLGITSRAINYIPGDAIDDQVLNNLKSGDYVGVYSPLEGLDVSHVGIVVRHDGQVWFRNASSLMINKKVVDSPFMEYMRSKPGMVVLRAINAGS